MSSLAKYPKRTVYCCPAVTARKSTVKPRCVLLYALPVLGLGLDVLRQIRKAMASSVASTAVWRQIDEEFSPIALAVQVRFLLDLVQVHRPSTTSAFAIPSPFSRNLEP